MTWKPPTDTNFVLDDAHDAFATLIEQEDAAMSNQRGLYEKFQVNRTDGRSWPSEKHDGCNYFVLDLTHDPHAIPAILAYAESCKDTHSALSADLTALYAPAATACMCPHCGQDVDLIRGLTAYHNWPLLTRQICPGIGQNPRNAESDGRPLWNGESNPRYYRNIITEEDQ